VTPIDPSDLQDVQLSLRGDGDAYARLIRRYQDDIAAQMRRFTRNAAMVEELVQDVFVEAYTSLPGYRGDAPLLHWLRRIATRAGYRYWKQRRRHDRGRVALEDWDQLPAPGSGRDLQQKEAADLLDWLLGQLSPADRLAVTLLHLEELSVAQVARRTGWSRVGVKVRAHRARKKLRAMLEKMNLSDGS